ncbi:MAG: peptide ABC transporter substrate-binding protein [Deltaproteobacteria bacterium]|nr:peptide ABC transporter substrate-binding protein [Deltaproteobacteria bacterium]
MKKIIIPVFLIVVGLSVYFLSQNKSQSDQNQRVFSFRLRTDPPTFDWSLATDAVSIDVIENIMDGLLQYDDNLEPIPAIAKSWDVSHDGKTFTFHLRNDVYWTDGKVVTAHDFEYSWKRFLNPKTAAEYAYFLYDVQGAEDYNQGVSKNADTVAAKALDDFTFEVKLRNPASFFLHIPVFMVAYPQRQDIIEKFGDQWTKPENIVTCGAYTLAQIDFKNKVVLKANPKYYEGKPALEEVHALIIKSDHTAVDLFETQKLDVLRDIPPLTLDQYKNDPRFFKSPFLRGYYYGFNIKKKPFDDVRVRRAFAHSIDKTVFPDILKGGQIPTNSWVPTGMMGHEPDVGLKFDLEKARKLLADAGYPEGKGLPHVEVHFDSRDLNKTVAEKLQQVWKQNLSVSVELQNSEWKVYLKQVHIDSPQVWRMGWGADFPDPDNFLRLFTTNSGNNFTRWGSKEFDQLILKAASSFNKEERLKSYKRAQQILLEEDTVIVPLFVESLNYMIHPRVEKYWLNAMEKVSLKKVRLKKL